MTPREGLRGCSQLLTLRSSFCSALEPFLSLDCCYLEPDDIFGCNSPRRRFPLLLGSALWGWEAGGWHSLCSGRKQEFWGNIKLAFTLYIHMSWLRAISQDLVCASTTTDQNSAILHAVSRPRILFFLPSRSSLLRSTRNESLLLLQEFCYRGISLPHVMIAFGEKGKIAAKQ